MSRKQRSGSKSPAYIEAHPEFTEKVLRLRSRMKLDRTETISTLALMLCGSLAQAALDPKNGTGAAVEFGDALAKLIRHTVRNPTVELAYGSLVYPEAELRQAETTLARDAAKKRQPRRKRG